MELEGGTAVLRIFADSVQDMSLSLISEARSSGGAHESKKSSMSKAILSLHTAFLCVEGRGESRKLLDALSAVVEAVRSKTLTRCLDQHSGMLPETLIYFLSIVQEAGKTCMSLGCLVLALRAVRAACINTPSTDGQSLASVVRACSDLCLQQRCSKEEACALMELLSSAPPASLWDDVSNVVLDLFNRETEVISCVVRDLPFLMLRCSTMRVSAEKWLEIISKYVNCPESNSCLVESGCGAIADIVCIMCCHKELGIKRCQVQEMRKGTNEVWGLGLWGWGGHGEERKMATCPHCKPDENGVPSKEAVGFLPAKVANKILVALEPLLTSTAAAEVGDRVQAAAFRALPSILAHVRPSELEKHPKILQQVIDQITAPGVESAGSSAVRGAACVALGSMVSRGGGHFRACTALASLLIPRLSG